MFSKNHFFICGDLNSKHTFWNNIRSNAAGNALFNEMTRCAFNIHFSLTPTYYPKQRNHNPSNIDIVLSNDLHNITSLRTTSNIMSDHLPVEFTVNCCKPFLVSPKKHFRYDLTNWKSFQLYLNNKIFLNNLH